MIKLVIFAAVAISVGLSKSSKSSDVNRLSQSDVELLLKSRLDLTTDDLKNECKVDFESAWPKIRAAFYRVFKVEDAASKKAGKKYPFSDDRTGDYFSALLKKSKPYNKASNELIDAALPCASEERKAKIIQFAKDQICHSAAGLSESSKSSDVTSLSQSEVEIVLKSKFDLTPADMKNECQVKFESAWSTIGAAVDKLFKAEYDANQKAEKKYPFPDNKAGDYVVDLLEKSKPYKKANKDIIDAALPCASKERKAKIMKFVKDQLNHDKTELSK